MEIQKFIEDTAKSMIPEAALTTIAADRRAFGDDVIAAFRTQIELRSTQAQVVLDAAARLAETRYSPASSAVTTNVSASGTASWRYSGRRAGGRAQRAFGPATQTSAAIITGRRSEEGTFLGLELRELVGGSGAGATSRPRSTPARSSTGWRPESVALRSGIRVITTDR